LNLWGQNSFHSKPGTSFWMLYPDRAACPVLTADVPEQDLLSEVCHWGFDFHQRIRWMKKPRKFKPGDTMKIKHAMTAYPPREAEKIFLTTSLHDQQVNPRSYNKNERFWGQNVPNLYAFAVCDPAGTDFSRVYNVRVPYVGWQFVGKYAIDDKVGHGDTMSMRLDGPKVKTSAFIYHHMIDSNAKRYLCTLWLKTRGTTGPGPVFTLRYPWRKEAPVDTIKTGITGDTDWQKISFVTTIPVLIWPTYDASQIFLSLEG
ncbi:unnamed protein product, partial [marine sediment metagenome]